ncbi:unnamed protein product [Moneuplotes crassus]|uniref:Uncharacterized protein n=1 Tax=Euplotes crassus TaxID=5936 RepID=A0AAD2DAL4_EUPCR|nr:unnamed protein product [Moneuplotes crassus]
MYWKSLAIVLILGLVHQALGQITKIESNEQCVACAFNDQRICSDSDHHRDIYCCNHDVFDTRCGAHSGICADEFNTTGGIGKNLLLCPNADECGQGVFELNEGENVSLDLTDIPQGKACIFRVRNIGPEIFKFNLTSCQINSMKMQLFLLEEGPYDFEYKGSYTCEDNTELEVKVPKQEDLFLILLPEMSANNFAITIYPVLSEETRMTLIVILSIVFGTMLSIAVAVIISCIAVKIHNKRRSKSNERSTSDPASPKKTREGKGSFDDTLNDSMLEKNDDEMKINQSVSSSASEHKAPYYKQYKND